MKIQVIQNGTTKIRVPEYATYTVIYSPQTFEGATVMLTTFDNVPLKNGLLAEADQYRIDHGKGFELNLEVSGFSSAFTIVILFGKTS